MSYTLFLFLAVHNNIAICTYFAIYVHKLYADTITIFRYYCFLIDKIV